MHTPHLPEVLFHRPCQLSIYHPPLALPWLAQPSFAHCSPRGGCGKKWALPLDPRPRAHAVICSAPVPSSVPSPPPPLVAFAPSSAPAAPASDAVSPASAAPASHAVSPASAAPASHAASPASAAPALAPASLESAAPAHVPAPAASGTPAASAIDDAETGAAVWMAACSDFQPYGPSHRWPERQPSAAAAAQNTAAAGGTGSVSVWPCLWQQGLQVLRAQAPCPQHHA
eukprot:1160983-Pelagomonas_calceolata.AAC.2